jgi:hypothetical protein
MPPIPTSLGPHLAVFWHFAIASLRASSLYPTITKSYHQNSFLRPE